MSVSSVILLVSLFNLIYFFLKVYIYFLLDTNEGGFFLVRNDLFCGREFRSCWEYNDEIVIFVVFFDRFLLNIWIIII